ncbi:MAG: HAD family hydrolase [Spirochaetales bacterium]|uniref:phosphoglycolate phosphatase n=1 Tax=Candidatus Thalassospirochaeta sargassi TaxID=3119039 RepID=A0AAJ1MN66_9SPIO|nr:HAD family hydrolase [Spirochaetales bacterium]
MKKAAIIFDHDGTLVNSIDSVAFCTNMVLRQWDFHELTNEEVLDGFPYPTAERFLYHTKSDDSAEAKLMADKFYELMNGIGIEHLKVYPGVREALDVLAGYGYSMGMVTNNQGLFVRKAAAHLHYAYDLEIILGEENVRASKPAPDGILQACAGLSARPENCWYIGDTETDCNAAKAAGLKSGAVTWGVHSEEQLRACGADEVFRTPAEMAGFFIRLDAGNKR